MVYHADELRILAEAQVRTPCEHGNVVLLDAADEIDRLTAELAEVRRTINEAAFERAEAISTDDLVTRLTNELARKDVELEAWRGGRLHTCLVDNGNMAVDAIKIVDCGHTSFFDTINAAVDALMAERGASDG